MSEFDAVIDFGSNNLRIGVFDSQSKIIYSSKVSMRDSLYNEKSNNYLNELIRDAERHLSIHLENIKVLYDSSKFYSIDLSIKKIFDQPTIIKKHYDSLIEEANFIISQNNFKAQVLHIIVNNIIADNNKVEKIIDDFEIKSLTLEIKFICLNKSLIDDISNEFKKNNLVVSNIYCSSYVRTFFYKEKIEAKNDYIFLDIGYQRTCALFFNNEKFEFFNSIPIGGNNITKDISKILKLNIDYSEVLKINFNKNEDELSFNKNLTNNNPFSEVLEKNISVDLLKQIIEARVNEIIELSVFQSDYVKQNKTLQKPSIIFIGNGSKLLSKYYNFDLKKKFTELIFFEENDSMICEAGLWYYLSDESILTNAKKKSKKVGFFESFFNIFSK